MCAAVACVVAAAGLAAGRAGAQSDANAWARRLAAYPPAREPDETTDAFRARRLRAAAGGDTMRVFTVPAADSSFTCGVSVRYAADSGVAFVSVFTPSVRPADDRLVVAPLACATRDGRRDGGRTARGATTRGRPFVSEETVAAVPQAGAGILRAWRVLLDPATARAVVPSLRVRAVVVLGADLDRRLVTTVRDSLAPTYADRTDYTRVVHVVRARTVSLTVVDVRTGVVYGRGPDPTAAQPTAQPATLAGPAGASDEVRCVDLPPGAAPPAVGCVNLAHRGGLTFPDFLVTWRLYRFPTRGAAEAARSPTGLVAEAGGAVWLSEVAPAREPVAAPPGGTLVTERGPLVLAPAPAYAASLAYAVMRPGMRSRVHVHAGPEAFYVLAGAQCLETPAGAARTRAGEAADVAAGVPMVLVAAGPGERRALALVLHDAGRPQAEAAAWRPAGACAP
ncbi:hypothetical protein tb265_20160 [Gemmatimonadetes bacterium T265]|nr:hypothetical protein tb265_20160 [Gemmatimonadetes bacterium T265]